jgi:hypothetical protein
MVFHVTTREIAHDIAAHGFLGGWGDIGFGVYFYGALGSAVRYARGEAGAASFEERML